MQFTFGPNAPWRAVMVTLALMATVGRAQSATVLGGGGLGAWRGDGALGDQPGTWHVELRAERRLRWGLHGVLGLGYSRVALRGDDVGVCAPLPGGGCARDSVFPHGTFWLGPAVLLRPRPSPLGVRVGGGVADPGAPIAGASGSDIPPLTSAAAGFWEVGLELRLWRGARAPRLDFSRRRLARTLYDAKHHSVLTMVVPLGHLPR